MTCLEKLRELKPDWDEDKINTYVKECCPHHAYIAHDPVWCMKTYDCEKCWNRLLKNYEHCNDYEFSVKLDGADMRILDSLCGGVNKSRNEVISSALYFLEQSLLYDPAMDLTIKEK